MNFIDSHTHLYLEEFEKDIPETINRAIDAGINNMVLPNIDSTSVKPMLDLCNKFKNNCFPAMGLHPGSVKENYKEELEIVRSWLTKEKFVAIGEVGIDLYWDKTFFNEQVEAFKFQLSLAKDFNLPVIIHSRNALNEIIQILNEKQFHDIKVVFHCFPGSLEQAQYLTGKGYLLGIGGVVTYKNSCLAKIAKELPLQNIILETDSPYLPPVPYRGQRNESAYIKTIAEFIALVRQTSVAEVAEITTNAAKEFFNI
jgi:TatD DNase family protein